MLSLGDGFILPLPLPWSRSGVAGVSQSTNFDSKMDTSETLKMELSPARELNLGCFQNCFGFIFRILKIMKFAVLPAWEHSF